MADSNIDVAAMRYISPREVANILGRTVRTLRNIAEEDERFPRPARVGRRLMFKEAEFLDWYWINDGKRYWVFENAR